MAEDMGDPLNGCSWCLQLDEILSDAENEAIPDTGKPIVTIGRRNRGTECSTCQFFLLHGAEYKRKYVLQVRLFDRIRQARLDDATPVPKRFLCVIRQNERLSYDHATQKEAVQQGIVQYQRRTGSSLGGISVLDPNRVNYASLLSSMRHCKDSHESCCSTVANVSDLSYINLIDCETSRIIRADPNMDYLALSYVWGQSNKSEPGHGSDTVVQDPNGMHSLDAMPLTIQDAIQVVRNLGMKYLWVDRYCINQGDAQEKKLMISHMDQVYERAEATIVALDGASDESGLPGVSAAKIPQPHIQTSQWQFISSFPPIGTLISRSIWATRGWTYQEARLSRRCLFFTNHQVYLVCRHETSSEALHSTSHDTVSALLNSGSLDSAFFPPQGGLNGVHFQDRHIYSRKELSFHSDALDAFRGILQRSDFISFWGVPIVPYPAEMDGNAGFAMGLLWCRRPEWSLDRHLVQDVSGDMSRRSNFPTWSWASVTGEIYNEGYGPQSIFGAYLNGMTKAHGTNNAHVRFWFLYKEAYTLVNDVILDSSAKIIPEVALSQRIQVEGDIVRLYRHRDKGYAVQGMERADLIFPPSPDITPENAQIDGDGKTEYALILINRNDSQRTSRRRFILMWIEWLEEGVVAMRRGLFSNYRLEYSAESLGRIPKTRMKFFLQ